METPLRLGRRVGGRSLPYIQRARRLISLTDLAVTPAECGDPPSGHRATVGGQCRRLIVSDMKLGPRVTMNGIGEGSVGGLCDLTPDGVILSV